MTEHEVSPPRIRKRGGINTGNGPDSTRIGHHGEIPSRDTYGFIKPVTRGRHRIYALDAYAISTDAIEVLRRLHTTGPCDPVMVVLVAEDDTGDVYEFDAGMFFNPDNHGSDANPVPESMLHDSSDPQVYASCDAARKWPDFAADVWIHDEHTSGGRDYAPEDTANEPDTGDDFQTGLDAYEAGGGK